MGVLAPGEKKIKIGLNIVVGRKTVSAFAHYFKLMWQIK